MSRIFEVNGELILFSVQHRISLESRRHFFSRGYLMQRKFQLAGGDEIPALGLGTWLAGPGEVKNEMFVSNGLLAGKLRTVQSVSTLRFDGATGSTKPSIVAFG